MAYQLGIDVGTSFTCIALARDGRVDVCQLGHTSQLVPSIVSIRDDGVVLTGEAAERRWVTDPARTVREFKRRFGDPSPVVLGRWLTLRVCGSGVPGFGGADRPRPHRRLCPRRRCRGPLV